MTAERKNAVRRTVFAPPVIDRGLMSGGQRDRGQYVIPGG